MGYALSIVQGEERRVQGYKVSHSLDCSDHILQTDRTDELMLEMFRHSIQLSKVPPAAIGDICVGTVLTPDAMYKARGAALAAGIPESVPIQCINRFCSSGLMATTTIANQIRAGQIEIGLAVGVESMSEKSVSSFGRLSMMSEYLWHSPDNAGPVLSDEVGANTAARDGCQPMGWTSENVGAEFNIPREEIDAFAAQSYQRAEHAQKAGYFAREIVPFTAYEKDPVTGARKKIQVSQDDGIRPNTTKEGLGKIRPAFPKWGNLTTGGNASQVTDGAAAVMLMTRRKAEELGLPILAKYITTAVAGKTFPSILYWC